MKSTQYTDGTYLEKVKDWHASDSPWKAAQICRMIKKHNLLIRCVHDVGCGAGEVLAQLQLQLGPEVELVGYDISPQAIAMANGRTNERLRFRQEDYLTADVGPADLTLLLDVFEHVPDYIGFLSDLKKRSAWTIFHIPIDVCAIAVLRRSGYMLYMRNTYGHLHHFTKETALASVSDSGFRIADFFYTDDHDIYTSTLAQSFRGRVKRRIRRLLYHAKPDLAVSLLPNFNLMLLAQGEIARSSSPTLSVRWTPFFGPGRGGS